MHEKERRGNTALGRDLGLSESSLRTTWRKRDKIHASIKANGTSKLDSRKRATDWKVIKIERYLNAWISKKECEGVYYNINSQERRHQRQENLPSNKPVGSRTQAFYKVFTNMISTKLDSNQPREQAGFQSGYSTMITSICH